MCESNGEKTKRNVVIYSRYSRSKEREEHRGQVRMCREYAEKNDLNVLRVFEDNGYSGAVFNRPALQELITYVRSVKADVLVWRMDRLARGVLLSETIWNKMQSWGIEIICVTGTIGGTGPEAKMIRQIVAAVSEFERELIGARTAAAFRQMIAEGTLKLPNPPYGQVWDDEAKRMVTNDYEVEVMEKFEELRRQNMGYIKIAKELNRLGFRMRGDKPWCRISTYRSWKSYLKRTGKKDPSSNKPSTSLGNNLKPSTIAELKLKGRK